MNKYVLLLCCTLPSFAAAQAQSPFQATTDVNTVLKLLKGPVDLYGSQFGSLAFQRGILGLAQSKAVTVRVLTNPASAPNMRPLKSVGAQVYTLPSKFTGGLVIVRDRAVIIPTGKGFNYLTTPNNVAQFQTMLSQYWPLATPY